MGPLATPRAPTVKQGPTTCTLKASTQPVYGASLYTARLALASAPLSYVQTKQSTGARFLFDGLTAGELYNVGVNAIGSAGPSDWSNDAPAESFNTRKREGEKALSQVNANWRAE